MSSICTPLLPLRQVISRHGLVARKSLGQHFLLDLNLIRRIVRAADIRQGVSVLEVGAGPGGLTRALLESAASRVVAVERDIRASAALRELVPASNGRLTLIEGDALKIEAAALVDPPAQIVANLPYNIATQLLLNYLPAIGKFKRLTLMFQREVAQRIVAKPGNKQYGRLSVIVQWLCEVRVLFDVPARAFTPEPKVVSSVVELLPRVQPLGIACMPSLERVTAATFGQRRKMLRTSLRKLCPDSLSLLETAGLSPTARPEEVSVAGFCSLSRALDAGAGSRTID